MIYLRQRKVQNNYFELVRSSMFSVESLMFDDVRSVAGAGVFSD
jgi:hypothetical protein